KYCAPRRQLSISPEAMAGVWMRGGSSASCCDRWRECTIVSMTFHVRAARRAELPEICELLALAFDEAAPGMFVAQTQCDSTFRLRHARVAVSVGRVVGYVRIFARTMLVRGTPVAAG